MSQKQQCVDYKHTEFSHWKKERSTFFWKKKSKLNCLSYKQLLLFFPPVLAQLIWLYTGWFGEEIMMAMQQLLSIKSWDSKEDNVLTFVQCELPIKSNTAKQFQYKIHSFYSPEESKSKNYRSNRKKIQLLLKKTAHRVANSNNQKLGICFYYNSRWFQRLNQKVTLRNERNLRQVKVFMNNQTTAILDLKEIFASPFELVNNII